MHDVLAVANNRQKKLAAFASVRSLQAHAVQTADEVLKTCDIIISTVPASPGFTPFLDARNLKPDALAVMVDLGRSWIVESFAAFDYTATDSLHQSRHPYDNQGNELISVTAQGDLESLIRQPLIARGRKAFFFKGIAAADIAVATIVYQGAIETSCGILLER